MRLSQNLVHPEWNLSRNESQTDGTVYQSQKQLDVYMHTAVGPSLSEKVYLFFFFFNIEPNTAFMRFVIRYVQDLIIQILNQA